MAISTAKELFIHSTYQSVKRDLVILPYHRVGLFIYGLKNSQATSSGAGCNNKRHKLLYRPGSQQVNVMMETIIVILAAFSIISYRGAAPASSSCFIFFFLGNNDLISKEQREVDSVRLMRVLSFLR